MDMMMMKILITKYITMEPKYQTLILKKLIELIEHNTHNMWDSNLQSTTDCIILEDKELRDMVYKEDTMEKDFKNHKFNGSEILRIVDLLKKDLYNSSDWEEELIYVTNSTKTGLPLMIETDSELANYLRENNYDEDNELSDEYLINEAVNIGEVRQVRRKELKDYNN